MVRQHVHAAGKLNAGPSAPLAEVSAFAATQAVWRFLHNDRVTLPLLAEPLQAVGQRWHQEHATAWALVIHDWSALSYPTHARKKDRKTHGSPHSHGYDLGTLLLVDGRTGDPVAPLEMELRTAQAISSTRPTVPPREASRLDNILPAMQALDRLGLQERGVHIIDREADSLLHYRTWDAERRHFLVRADEQRYVRWQGEEVTLAELYGRLQTQGHFRRSRDITYQGQMAVQHVAETTVVLDRPAWRQRRQNGRVRKERVPGEPLTLRLIVSRVCNAQGVTVAWWCLFTNVPTDVAAATVALWYYWRWRIESFFKLLKSAGQAVEQWQQEGGEAIAKRLLVAAMACVLVWKLERAAMPEALSFRAFLVRLSGRQMKYGTSHTAPALLAGLYVYLAMVESLDQHSVEELRAMKRHLHLTNPDTG